MYFLEFAGNRGGGNKLQRADKGKKNKQIKKNAHESEVLLRPKLRWFGTSHHNLLMFYINIITISTMIKGLTILDKLGEGSFGTIYIAKD